MVKPRTNYFLDVLIFGAFVVILVSGLLLWVVYPHGAHAGAGSGRGRGASVAVADNTALLGLDRQDMSAIHSWGGVLLGALVVLHVAFHWKWIVCQTGRLFGRSSRSRRSSRLDRACPER